MRSRRDQAGSATFATGCYGGTVTGVRVNEDSFIVLTATVPSDDVIDVTIAVGPDSTCACKVSTADGHAASAAPDVRGSEQILASRMAEAGVQARTGDDRS